MAPLIRNFFVLLCVVVISFGLTIIDNKKIVSPYPSSHTQTIENFSIKKLNSDETIISLTNKTIIHFWATWCPPCIVELPELFKFAAKHHEINILLIAVQDNPDKIDNFMKTNNLNPHLVDMAMDPDWQITKNIFQIKKLPTTVFIQNNTLSKKLDGMVNWAEYIDLSTIDAWDNHVDK